LHAEWKALARRAGFHVSLDDRITVDLDGGGRQVISFSLHKLQPVVRGRSIIASARVISEAADGFSLRYAWERNRLSDLVGFTVDKRGRLVGETWIPIDGLTSDEFALYVNELARVSDWHEFRLTGEDIY
jgi:hypothetical protein